jgi:N-dimethylarginine dimethylaminohydrolase
MRGPSEKVFLPSGINFTLAEIPDRKDSDKVLMCTPEYFDVIDVKNVHMKNQQGRIDKKLANEQWQQLKGIYQTLKNNNTATDVLSIPGAQGLEDMVFAANQSFPWITESGEKVVIMSRMRHESRKKEVQYFREFYKELGYRIIELQHTELFEGMGDAIPHPGKRLIYGGYGHRTSVSAYDEISEILNVKIVALKLINEKFYHLDTCFVPLGQDSVMLYPGAFQPEDLKGLKKLFNDMIEIPEEEASRNFSLNAHVVISEKSKAAILQKGSPVTVSALKNKGFQVFETDTSEYIKSGGSVFCMKMMIY